jgi:hypothetical protein
MIVEEGNRTSLLRRSEQEASSQQNADDYEDCDDDDLNKAHDRLTSSWEFLTAAILIAVTGAVNGFICKEL